MYLLLYTILQSNILPLEWNFHDNVMYSSLLQVDYY